MSTTVETLNFLIGTGGVVMLAASLVLFVDIFVLHRKHFSPFIERWGLTVASVLLVGALVMALVYSEVFGFVPCGLCWAMRIFVFSQALIIPVAAYRNDVGIALYGLVLAIPGALTGLYQHYLQMGGTELIACPTTGPGADCAKRILFEYGFMTFPLMGASMLLLLIAIYLYLYRSARA